MVSSITALQGLYVALGGELSDVANITTIPDMLEAISTVASAAASELPAVTADDNGKVLMVVDGEWGLGSVPQYYTVSYNLNGGSGTTPLDQDVRAGSSLTAAGMPDDITPPAGFINFLGWDTDPNHGYPARVPAGSTYTPEGDTVLYAIYGAEI